MSEDNQPLTEENAKVRGEIEKLNTRLKDMSKVLKRIEENTRKKDEALLPQKLTIKKKASIMEPLKKPERKEFPSTPD